MLARSDGDQALHRTISEVERLRDRLHAENLYLRREVQERLGTSTIIGQSLAIRRVLEQAKQVAATDSTVLLLGETGTGKELVASLIHELSARRKQVTMRRWRFCGRRGRSWQGLGWRCVGIYFRRMRWCRWFASAGSFEIRPCGIDLTIASAKTAAAHLASPSLSRRWAR